VPFFYHIEMNKLVQSSIKLISIIVEILYDINTYFDYNRNKKAPSILEEASILTSTYVFFLSIFKIVGSTLKVINTLVIIPTHINTDTLKWI